jgi:hypothetical protein
MAKSRIVLSCSLLLVLLLATLAPAQAQVAKKGYDTLSSLAFQSEKLEPSQPFEPFSDVQSAVASATQSAWQSFALNAPVEWRAAVDKRTGRISFAEGGNIAWIPGRGNSLGLADLAPVLKPGSKKVDLAAMETIARNYLPKVAGMLGVDPKTLVLNLGRSGQPAGHVWFVDLDFVLKGQQV